MSKRRSCHHPRTPETFDAQTGCRICGRERKRKRRLAFDPVERAQEHWRLTPKGPFICKGCGTEFYSRGRSTTSPGANGYCSRKCQGKGRGEAMKKVWAAWRAQQ